MNTSFFRKGIQQSSLIIEMMIQKHLKGLERIEALITSHVKVFLGNKYNSRIHTARNAKPTSTKYVYKKIVMKCKKKVFQSRI